MSAAVRDRKNTGGKRHLTLSGPVSGIALAKELAMKYIVESQRKNVPFEPSPMKSGDWEATEKQESRPNNKKSTMASRALSKGQLSAPTWSGSSPSSSSLSPWSPQLCMPQAPHLMAAVLQMHQMQQMQQMQHMQQMQQMQQMMQMQHMCHPQMERDLPAASGRDQTSSSDSEDADLEAEPAHVKLQQEVPKMSFREGVPAKVPTAKLASEQGAKKSEKQQEIVVSEKVAEKKTERDQVAAKRPVEKKPQAAMPVVAKERPIAKVVPKVPLPAVDVAAGSLAMRFTVPSSRKRRLIAGGRDPTVRYVEISAMGWKTEGCGFTQNKSVLYENLRSRIEFRGVPSADILIDCRPLKRYDLPGYILSHTGYHNMILLQAIDHNLFMPTMIDVVQTVRVLMDSGKDAAHVWAMCTGGNHRSVAFSLVLEYVLCRMQYHVRIRHFSKSSWESRGLCMNCDQCDDEHEYKVKAYAEVYRKVTLALGL